ncbi:hypothetical protein CYY_009289, partial [Polysphondylium violaceum]
SIVATNEVNKAGKWVGTINPKLTLNPHLKTPGTASVSLNTDAFNKGEITFDSLFPGLKTVLTVDSKKIFSTEFQYKKDKFAVTLLGKNDKSVLSSVSFAINSMFSVGVQTEYNFAKSSVKGVNATLVAKPRSDILITLTDKYIDGLLSVSTLYKPSAKVLVGGDVTVDLKAPQASPAFNLGAQYFINDASSLKFKINEASKLGLAYLITVNNNTKASASWNINGKDFKQGNSFGLNLTVSF